MMATEFLNVVGGIRHIFSRNRWDFDHPQPLWSMALGLPN
jgi:hypothetical protein